MIYSRRLKLRDLAHRLECRLEGDGGLEISGVAGIEKAGPGELTFVANPRYASALRDTKASAVILSEAAPAVPLAVLRSANPYLAFARAIGLFAEPPVFPPGVHPSAVVAADVVLGPGVSIGPCVCIEAGVRIGARTIIRAHSFVGQGASIGDDCLIHSRVSIRERVVIGHRVIAQDGAVIGSDGYGFARRADGTYEKIPQHAAVVVEDDVEIGANAAIDRPAVGETRICAGAKLDNLVQVGHGVHVGRNTMLCGQVGIAGSAFVGDNVVLAGQVGVGGHIEIGDGVVASGQTGITNSVDPRTHVAGYPAIPSRDWLRASAVYKRLPELKKAVAELHERLAAAEEWIDAARRR